MIDARAPVDVADAARSARTFRGLRWRLVRNGARSILAGSQIRAVVIVACSAIFWSGLFWLFFSGFRFMGEYLPLTDQLVEYLFSMFFLSLLVMLVFSTGIITHTGLFQSREAGYLLTLPSSADRVFAYKFAEAVAFSSWGFLLLGSPLMVAYGIAVGASWGYYAIFFAFLVTFVLIPGGLGAIAAILVANFMPRRRKTVLAFAATAVLGVAGFWAYRTWNAPGAALSPDWLDSMVGRLAFSQHPLWPSRWMSAGLVAAARGSWADSSFYLFLLASNGALAYLIAAAVARDLYRQGYERTQGNRNSRRRAGGYAFDAVFHRAFGFLPRPIRLLILKDVRTFRRDPAQWSQFLIFFGLLTFYFVNIRRLSYDVQSPYWRYLISFLNLAVTALILSTFTSRFIFPLLSLEGRNLWVLGLLPLERSSILWGKFAFASGISLVATEVLVVLSDLMLRMNSAMIALHVGMVAVLCFGLSGISVGLGARLPDLKEDDPSKIATGFGGTLNLLVSLAFILAIVATLAVPCHYYFNDQLASGVVSFTLTDAQFRVWMAIAIAGTLVVGLVGTFLPLWIGIRAFRRMEF